MASFLEIRRALEPPPTLEESSSSSPRSRTEKSTTRSTLETRMGRKYSLPAFGRGGERMDEVGCSARYLIEEQGHKEEEKEKAETNFRRQLIGRGSVGNPNRLIQFLHTESSLFSFSPPLSTPRGVSHLSATALPRHPIFSFLSTRMGSLLSVSNGS